MIPRARPRISTPTRISRCRACSLTSFGYSHSHEFRRHSDGSPGEEPNPIAKWAGRAGSWFLTVIITLITLLILVGVFKATICVPSPLQRLARNTGPSERRRKETD